MQKQTKHTVTHTHTWMTTHPYGGVRWHHVWVWKTWGKTPQTARRTTSTDRNGDTCQSPYTTVFWAKLDVGTGGGLSYNGSTSNSTTLKPNMTHHLLQWSPDTEHNNKLWASLWASANIMRDSSEITLFREGQNKYKSDALTFHKGRMLDMCCQESVQINFNISPPCKSNAYGLRLWRKSGKGKRFKM